MIIGAKIYKQHISGPLCFAPLTALRDAFQYVARRGSLRSNFIEMCRFGCRRVEQSQKQTAQTEVKIATHISQDRAEAGAEEGVGDT